MRSSGMRGRRLRHAPQARSSGPWLRAYAYRNQTVVANAAEVEVNRRTGRVWVKRLVCSHDCGLVINPEALRRTIEAATLHGLSRARRGGHVRHRKGDDR